MDIELSRRAIACDGWRWLPGMLAVLNEGDYHGSHRVYQERYDDLGGWLPDLGDPATLGCLLALVRDYREDPYVYVQSNCDRTYSAVIHDEQCDSYETEAQALVAELDVGL